MLKPGVIVDHAHHQRATRRARAWNQRILETAAALQSDADRERRLEAQLCACCYYVRSPQLSQPAVARQPCGLCGTVQIYPTLATDVLCLECAKQADLCKRCGADLELRPDRVLRLPQADRTGRTVDL